MPLVTWIIWLLVALAIGALAAAAARGIRLRWVPSLLVAAVAAGGALAGLYLWASAAKPTPVVVAIVEPKSMEQVEGARLRVSGTVSPSRARVTLLVRSERDLRWWAQSVVTSADAGGGVGSWSIDAHLGTREAGARENFQIVALASADGSLFNLLTGRAVSGNTTLTSVPLWEKSAPVVVRRTR